MGFQTLFKFVKCNHRCEGMNQQQYTGPISARRSENTSDLFSSVRDRPGGYLKTVMTAKVNARVTTLLMA